MKKTYKNPLFTVVEIQPEEFIALSTLGETDATSGNLGREFEFSEWEEDQVIE